jgi:hypothetical protein
MSHPEASPQPNAQEPLTQEEIRQEWEKLLAKLAHIDHQISVGEFEVEPVVFPKSDPLENLRLIGPGDDDYGRDPFPTDQENDES